MFTLRKISLLTLIAALAAALAAPGCKSTGKGQGEPRDGEERPGTPGEPEQPPSATEKSYCFVGTDMKVYFYNADTGKYYVWNPQTHAWEEVDNPPPPLKPYDHIPLPPGVIVPEGGAIEDMGLPSILRTEWGLVPHQHGVYQPLMWFENFSSDNPLTPSADDTVDFYLMTKSTWVLATDTDPELKAAIGPENIFDWRIDLGDGLPPVGEVKLQGVTIRNLARFMVGTGFPTMTSHTPKGHWTLVVDQDQNVINMWWNGVPWQTIPLD